MSVISDYWNSQRLIVTIDGPDGQSVHAIDRPFARIGSHKSSDLVIADSKAPPKCLYLHAVSEGLFCLNLNRSSKSEEYFQGWLAPGQKIALGDYQISVELINGQISTAPVNGAEESFKSPQCLDARRSADPPYPLLKVLHRGKELSEVRLTRRLNLVGRSRSATIRVKTLKISDLHCVLFWESGELWAIDLLSTNGVRLDGKRIEAVKVPLGSVIQLGTVNLIFHGFDEKSSIGSTIEADLRQSPESAQPNIEQETQSGTDWKAHAMSQAHLLETEKADLASEQEKLNTEKAAWMEEKDKPEMGKQLTDRSQQLELEARRARQELQEQHQAIQQRQKELSALEQDMQNQRAAWREEQQRQTADLAEQAKQQADDFATQKGEIDARQQQLRAQADQLAGQLENLQAVQKEFAMRNKDQEQARSEREQYLLGLSNKLARQEAVAAQRKEENIAREQNFEQSASQGKKEQQLFQRERDELDRELQEHQQQASKHHEQQIQQQETFQKEKQNLRKDLAEKESHLEQEMLYLTAEREVLEKQRQEWEQEVEISQQQASERLQQVGQLETGIAAREEASQKAQDALDKEKQQLKKNLQQLDKAQQEMAAERRKWEKETAAIKQQLAQRNDQIAHLMKAWGPDSEALESEEEVLVGTPILENEVSLTHSSASLQASEERPLLDDEELDLLSEELEERGRDLTDRLASMREKKSFFWLILWLFLSIVGLSAAAGALAMGGYITADFLQSLPGGFLG